MAIVLPPTYLPYEDFDPAEKRELLFFDYDTLNAKFSNGQLTPGQRAMVGYEKFWYDYLYEKYPNTARIPFTQIFLRDDRKYYDNWREVFIDYEKKRLSEERSSLYQGSLSTSEIIKVDKNNSYDGSNSWVSECNQNLISLVNGDNTDLNQVCYKHDITNFDIDNATNPLNASETCKLVSTRKMQYYIHEADPYNVIENVVNLEPKFKDLDEYQYNLYKSYKNDILKAISNVFTVHKRFKCCNCISITLFIMNADVSIMLKYLRSIRRSILNVQKELPTYLVRLYLDSSVEYHYQTLKPSEFKEEVKNLLDFIYTAENVEIYTYICKSILSGEDSIKRVRSYRFIPFLDPTVNVCIVREADGFVTRMDCSNIRIFEKSNKIFYLMPGGIPIKTQYTDKPDPGGYREWLTNYIAFNSDFFYNDPDMFESFIRNSNNPQAEHGPGKKANVFDLLAGLIGIKMNVRKEYYYQSIEEINNLFARFVKINEGRKNTFNVGFDEILLLHMFKDLISSNVISKDDKLYYDQLNLELILELSFGEHNIVPYFVTNDKDIFYTKRDESGFCVESELTSKAEELSFYDKDFPEGELIYIDAFLNFENVKNMVDIYAFWCGGRDLNRISYFANEPYKWEIRYNETDPYQR